VIRFSLTAKKKTDSGTSFTLMSCRGTAEKKTAKSDPGIH
jgi:hypothetical protein